MKLTNDERHEVAAKLRELPIDMYEVEERWEAKGLGTDCHDQTDYYLIHFALFGCLPAEHMHLCDYEELHIRLADLIEPEERTCRIEYVKSGPFYDVFRFDCCGMEYSESRTDDGATELPLAVCPFCGAKVVDDHA